MSFLNSVLSSIGSKEEANQKPRTLSRSLPDGTSGPRERSAPVPRESIEGLATQPQFQSRKRKAEDVLPKENEKVRRNSQSSGPKFVAGSSTKPQLPEQSAQGANTMATSSVHKVPYRGTSRPSAPDDNVPGRPTVKDPKRPSISISSTVQTNVNRAMNRTLTAATTPNPATPSTPASDGTKVPKKGSYAEIMARARALQNTAPIGAIKHQPKAKKALSDKKELLLQKGLARKPKIVTKDGHNRTPSGDVSGESRPGSAGKLEGPVKKKAPEIAYRGTAKPKPQPTYKGTIKPATTPTLPIHKNSPTKSIDRSRSNSISRPTPSKSRRYDYSDEEEDDEEEEEDYDSGSDMEAGYSDVEEEETKATKIAKKEDEFEARMEAEMKRQKEARKKREAEIARSQKRNQY